MIDDQINEKLKNSLLNIQKLSRSNISLGGLLMVGEMDNVGNMFNLTDNNVDNDFWSTFSTGIFRYNYSGSGIVTINCHKQSIHFLNKAVLDSGFTVLGLEYNICMQFEIKNFDIGFKTVKTLNWLLQNKLTK